MLYLTRELKKHPSVRLKSSELKADLIRSRAAIFANTYFMRSESTSADDGQSNSAYSLENLTPLQSEIILNVSHAYTRLEDIARHDAMNLTDNGKANIRRAQSEIQKLRLKLLDLFKEGHLK